MATTRLSSKGQVIIPKSLREAHHWEPGQRLTVIDAGDAILLKPETPFPETSLDEVASSLQYQGRTKSLEDMEAAVRKGARETGRDRG